MNVQQLCTKFLFFILFSQLFNAIYASEPVTFDIQNNSDSSVYTLVFSKEFASVTLTQNPLYRAVEGSHEATLVLPMESMTATVTSIEAQAAADQVARPKIIASQLLQPDELARISCIHITKDQVLFVEFKPGDSCNPVLSTHSQKHSDQRSDQKVVTIKVRNDSESCSYRLVFSKQYASATLYPDPMCMSQTGRQSLAEGPNTSTVKIPLVEITASLLSVMSGTAEGQPRMSRILVSQLLHTHELTQISCIHITQDSNLFLEQKSKSLEPSGMTIIEDYQTAPSASCSAAPIQKLSVPTSAKPTKLFQGLSMVSKLTGTLGQWFWQTMEPTPVALAQPTSSEPAIKPKSEPSHRPKTSAPLCPITPKHDLLSGMSTYERETINLLDIIAHPCPAHIIRLIDLCIRTLPQETNPFQAMVLPLNSRIFVIGDIHCSYREFNAQIQRMRELNCFTSPQSLKLRENHYLVCTGDLADRGTQGTEVFMLAMILKILNPNNMFICRGNHETYDIAKAYGFFGASCGDQRISPELLLRFPGEYEQLIPAFQKLFDHLPLAVFLGLPNDQTGHIDFGLFNHAGVDNSANRLINHILQRAVSHPHIVQTCPSGLTEINGFMWRDYIEGTESREEADTRRGNGITTYTLAKVRESLALLEGKDYTIAFQARGHQHMNGGIFRLSPTSLFGDRAQDQQPITVAPKDIFMFMCTTMMNSFHSFGLGQFNMNAQGLWIMTPYIMSDEQITPCLR